MEDRLIPKTHMLKSIRSRSWTLAGAIEELLDNSILHGHAKTVTIVIDNAKGIAVADDGIGVDDINRIFRFGDASGYDVLAQIGQYGIGATHAIVYLGDVGTVETVRDGRKHVMKVDWKAVEKSGQWPLRYKGAGQPAKPGERGTTVLITRLAKHYQLTTSEKLATELGLIFAPALRAGANIEVYHQLTGGKRQQIKVEAFTPSDLTDVIEIKGSVQSKAYGELRWKGRAGLSASLVERFNKVHISFAHRVIEMTRDAFMGKSAPTLYVEVQLDETTPWKYQLSDHKDRVVGNSEDGRVHKIDIREKLMKSVFEAIKPLLEKSEKQAQNLALSLMISPIENTINKVMKKMGLLPYDPKEEPEEGGEREHEGPGPIDVKKKNVFNKNDDGPTTGKELPRPTGVHVEYTTADKLEGRAFGWGTSGNMFILQLDEAMFIEVLKWPINIRERHVMQLILAFLAHAFEMTYWNERPLLDRVMNKKAKDQIEAWATSDQQQIAPHLYRRMMEDVSRTLH